MPRLCEITAEAKEKRQLDYSRRGVRNQVPKVAPYGTPAMKGAAMAERNKDKRKERINCSLNVFKAKQGQMSDEKLAEIFGISYGTMKARRKDPSSYTLREVWRMIEVAAQYGETIDFGVGEIT